MRKKLLLMAAGIIAGGLLLGGGVYAWKNTPSDVSRPEPTPDANIVKYHVVGTSMDPTIRDGDWLLAQVNSKDFKRGEMVIMKYPKDESKVYVRRIVAVGGDRVVMKYYSNVKITTVFSSERPDGVQFPLGVVPNGNAYGEYDAQVDQGSFYVVGDNSVPGGSFDSDEWGLLPQADIVGLVTKRTAPSPRDF